MAPRLSRRFGLTVLPTLGALLPFAASAQTAPDSKFAERAQRAGEIIAELVREPDHSPPVSLLRKATCVAAVPEVIQVGLGIGGKVGFGVVSCRTANGWSRPTFMALKGGTLGFQIGGQSADVVLVFLNRDAAREIASTSFDLGGQVAVAAGPVGRNLSAETDYKLSAEIYSYSKARGLYAGINLSGTKWEIDSKANRMVYLDGKGGSVDAGDLLTTSGAAGPELIQPYLTALGKNIGPGKTQ